MSTTQETSAVQTSGSPPKLKFRIELPPVAQIRASLSMANISGVEEKLSATHPPRAEATWKEAEEDEIKPAIRRVGPGC